MTPVKKHAPTTRAVDQEGLPAYWGIETNRRPGQRWPLLGNQEGLPAYWGIETPYPRPNRLHATGCIRKDYPLTGVLKLILFSHRPLVTQRKIRKDYPLTGVLKLVCVAGCFCFEEDQEGLPAYWGIETQVSLVCTPYPPQSGRITRLLGY